MVRRVASLLIPFAGISFILGQANFEKGISHYKQGQYAKAIEEFEQIVKTHPDYESGHRILGDSYLRLKNYKKAIEAFENALQLQSDHYISYFGLALAFYNSGQFRNAVSILLKGEAQAGSPREQYQLYQTRGSAYYNIREFDRAIADLQTAISIQRGNFKDLLQLGISYYQTNAFEKAQEYLSQAVSLSPDSAEAKQYLARLQFQQGINAIESNQYQKAADLLTNYVSSYPEDADGWYNLGLAQLFIPDLEMAEEALLKSTELLSSNWEAYDRLGYIYEKKENYNRALQSYQRAHRVHQDPGIQQSVERIQERIQRIQQ